MWLNFLIKTCYLQTKKKYDKNSCCLRRCLSLDCFKKQIKKLIKFRTADPTEIRGTNKYVNRLASSALF